MSGLFEYALVRAIAALVRRVPLSLAHRIARFLGWALFRVAGYRRAVTIDNLTHAFPEKSREEIESIARRSYVHLFTTLLEMLRFPRVTKEGFQRHLTLRNISLFEEMIGRGKGVILLSAHCGNWEMLAYGGALLVEKPFTIIFHPLHNPRVDKFINAIRTHRGNRMVDMRMGVREIIGTLRASGVIAMLADQSGPKESTYVTFFGRQASAYEGPAALALRFRVPILCAFSTRTADGTYFVEPKELIYDDLPDASVENVRELTQRHTALLEAHIRTYPDQWLWQHRRWKHSPPAVQTG